MIAEPNTNSGLSWRDFIGQPINPEHREFPRPYLLRVVEMLKERGGKYVVEIGGLRMPLNHPIEELNVDCCLDSHSTVYWAKDFFTVCIDIDQAVIQNTARIVGNLGYGQNIAVMAMDGIEYLNRRDTPIDLLFLDAWDVNFPESPENHCRAFMIAEKNLHDNSLVLIDDTDVDLVNGQLVFANGISGKGKHVIPYALSKGWHIVFSGRQTLLSK